MPICTIKHLPKHLRIAAAERACALNPSNANTVKRLKRALPSLALAREDIALITDKYWGRSGVKLGVGFIDSPPSDLRARIIFHMNAWGASANVQFVESVTDPQVRVDRSSGGYWSYFGTDILAIDKSLPTMNLESFTMSTPESEFIRVVRHETGHTLGFPHEHERQEIVERIDRDKAIAYFKATQGWDEAETNSQVLTAWDASSLARSGLPDVESIMCYWLPASIMKDGIAVTGGADIDGEDFRYAASIYPKTDVSVPFHRRLSTSDGNHFWTTNPNEAIDPPWEDEQVACRVFELQVDGTVPLYRRLNRENGDHLWTIDPNEGVNPPWEDEQVACYVYPSQHPGAIALHRRLNSINGRHFYTTDPNEAVRHPWADEEIACYVLP